MPAFAFDRRFLARAIGLFALLVLGGCASTRACEGGSLAASPQYRAESCGFANPPNPDARPTQDGWRIWSRFFFGKKDGTVPVDPVPVRPLTQAQLDALPADANHIVRLAIPRTCSSCRAATG